MKTIIKRVLSAVLILAVVFSLPTVVSAEASLTYVHAYSDADNQHRLLALVEISGSPYINANDSLLLSGYEAYQEDVGKATFHYGAHKVEFKDGQKEYDGVYYYPLKELMDALSTRYHYEEVTNTLIFITCSTYYENLLADCESVYLDNYTLDFYEGTGWQLAGVYEILGGMRFDVLWGGYQQEIYKEAVAGIIAEADTESLSAIKQGDSVMSKLAKILNFVETDIDGIKTYEDFLGTDLDGIIEAYSLLNDLIPGISVKNAIEILEYVQESSSSAELYSNAVAYGLVQNTQISDWNLSHSADLVYAYYGNNKPTYEAVIQSLVDDVKNDILNEIPVGQITVDLIKEAVGSELGGIYINSAYVKLAKMIFDEMGMKERTSAIMQTVACRNIQEFAINQYLDIRSLNSYYALEGYSAKNERAKELKYSTILYLRACQYAYSLYEFDDTLGFATNYWKEKTQEAISLISSYSDDELGLTVENKKFDLSTAKTYEANDESIFIPEKIVLSDWNSGTEEQCPSITFRENMVCDVRFNMAEYIQDFSTKYELLISPDNQKAIKVDLTGIEISDLRAQGFTCFYLFEIEADLWRYYGTSTGYTQSWSLYKASSTSTILSESKRVEPVDGDIVGEYQLSNGSVLDILTVQTFNTEEMVFDAVWYRTADMYNANGSPFGNIIPFHYKEYNEGLNEYFYETTGIVEINSDSVVLTIFDTKLPYIETKSYTYEKAKPTVSEDELFDNTYWWLSFGQTMGTTYAAKFFNDGTFSAVSTGNGSVSMGTYDYYMGTLIINLDPYFNVYFNKNGSEFVSVEEYPMQVGSGCYTISPDNNATYNDYIR